MGTRRSVLPIVPQPGARGGAPFRAPGFDAAAELARVFGPR